MQLFDPNNPNEKKKMIVAAVLGVVAIIVLGYLFFGGGGSTQPANRATGSTDANSGARTVIHPPPDTGDDDRRDLSRDRLQRHRSRRARSRSEHFCLLRAATSSGKACAHTDADASTAAHRFERIAGQRFRAAPVISVCRSSATNLCRASELSLMAERWQRASLARNRSPRQ